MTREREARGGARTELAEGELGEAREHAREARARTTGDLRSPALDVLLTRLHEVARLLPALTAEKGADERRRLTAAVSRGESAVPRLTVEPRRLPRDTWGWLDTARRFADRIDSPTSALYLARLDELELDLQMLESLGDPRRIRPLAARRFGTGNGAAPYEGTMVPVARVAAAILDEVEPEEEDKALPATALFGEPSLAELMRRVAAHAGLEVEVKVEPRLTAGAATGERTIFLADRMFGAREALRLAVHEVLGHLTAAANGRAQPMRIIELGTAGSFGDQEGVALYLEELAGVMDGLRMRTLAARVWATDRMHDGASFSDTARLLATAHSFTPDDAVVITERAYRGGGVARDVGYLRGYLRVKHAVESGEATVDELRMGRVGLAELPLLRSLIEAELVRPAVYRPSLAYSLRPTDAGTSLLTSPPSFAASLTSWELT